MMSTGGPQGTPKWIRQYPTLRKNLFLFNFEGTHPVPQGTAEEALASDAEGEGGFASF